MKRFLIYITVFFILIGLLDFSFGLTADYLFRNAKGGDTKQLYDFCKKDSYDIVILGASRACHHYIPKIFEDSLHLTCYNAGYDGNGIILAYGLISEVLERYNPKLIIYDCAARFDWYESPEDQQNTRYLNLLKPFAEDTIIKPIFKSISPFEYIKTYSSIFRYNSRILELVKDNITHDNNFNKGYKPLLGVMKHENKPIPLGSNIDSTKILFLNFFIKKIKDKKIPLLVVISPTYDTSDYDKHYPLYDFFMQNNITTQNYIKDSAYNYHMEFFQDRVHLNDTGAKKFSIEICNNIKNSYFIHK